MAITVPQFSVTLEGLTSANVTTLTSAYSTNKGLVAEVSSPPVELGGPTPTFNLNVAITGAAIADEDATFVGAIMTMLTS